MHQTEISGDGDRAVVESVVVIAIIIVVAVVDVVAAAIAVPAEPHQGSLSVVSAAPPLSSHHPLSPLPLCCVRPSSDVVHVSLCSANLSICTIYVAFAATCLAQHCKQVLSSL